MNTRPRGDRGRHARRPILLSALAVAALVGASACGSAAPSAAPALSAPGASTATASVAAPSTAPVAADWVGFRGDASRSAVGLEGPIGNPVLDWQFKAGGAVPNQIAIVNAESGEDLHRIVTSAPLFGLSHVELQPLADITSLEQAAAALRRVAAVPA